MRSQSLAILPSASSYGANCWIGARDGSRSGETGRPVVLEAPFTSAVDVGARHYWFVPVRLFMKDQFRSDLRARKVTAPVLVVHGENDAVVPIDARQAAIWPDPGAQALRERCRRRAQRSRRPCSGGGETIYYRRSTPDGGSNEHRLRLMLSHRSTQNTGPSNDTFICSLPDCAFVVDRLADGPAFERPENLRLLRLLRRASARGVGVSARRIAK